MKQQAFYHSPIGILKIQIKNNCVHSLSKTTESFKTAVQKSSQKNINNRLLCQITQFLNNYFSKKNTKKALDIQSKNIPLCLRGTNFQQTIWKYLRTIPFGQTKTYAEIAKSANFAGAARAVGSACARNPFLILVPCHRVTAQKGLGGFALGLPAKVFLLNHESHPLKLRANNGVILNKRGPGVKSNYEVKTF